MAEPTTRLRIRVSPGAGTTELVGRHGDAWKVRVAAPRERGRANKALLALLAERLQVAPAELTLVAGRSGRDKVVELRGLGDEEAHRRLRGSA
jgi:uncharacterized protein (TIGR00251 family)